MGPCWSKVAVLFSTQAEPVQEKRVLETVDPSAVADPVSTNTTLLVAVGKAAIIDEEDAGGNRVVIGGCPYGLETRMESLCPYAELFLVGRKNLFGIGYIPD
jgi:hypothetical protein